MCYHGHVIRADVVFNRREREVTAALREIVTEDKMGAVTLHSPLTLATPIYAIHLGTHTYTHRTLLYTVGLHVPSLILPPLSLTLFLPSACHILLFPLLLNLRYR